MKVLVVGPDRQDPGGVANYYNAVFPRLANDSIATRYLEIGSTRGGGGVFHALTDQFRFWGMITKFGPDIIHLNPSLDLKSFIRDGLFVFLGKLRRRKVLVFFRGWQKPFELKVSGVFKPFFTITYKRADAFIVLAKEFSDSLRLWGVSVPISIGSTAVDDNLLAGFSVDEKAELVEKAEVIRLLYLARLERDKGVMELFSAVKTLLEQGFNLSLTIAGSGPVSDELEQQIKTLGDKKDAIKLVGYVRGAEKRAIFSSHHIFCFPTQYGEGMPNALLEAMAFGLPVITCPVGGIADFFEDGKMGVLIEEAAPNLIAVAISSSLENRDALVDMVRYNYDYAQSRFLASTVADYLRERYSDLSLTN